MKIKTILLKIKIGGARVEEARAVASLFAVDAIKNGFNVVFNVSDVTDPDTTVMIPIGGDGTVLAGAKDVIALGIPIIGINMGNVGFLTDINLRVNSADTFQPILEMLASSDSLKRDERTVLNVCINGINYTAMNDIVISDVYSDALINYELRVGSSNAGKHKANGVIISTPTGSTAYAMFAGGAIIEPDLDVLEIIHVAAMSMTTRPMIVSGSNIVNVRLTMTPGRTPAVKADGVTCPMTIPSNSSEISIDIERLTKKVILLHSKNWNFFDVLRNKLHWNH